MLEGKKTIIFNVVMGAIMMVRAMNPDAELPGEEAVNTGIDSMNVALTAIWGVGNLILRAITSAPVFWKK
jgi:hypothetical protein